jgi:chemotaxis protein CheD
MNERNCVTIRIGEVKIGAGTDILKTTLGSCVGIAFVWKAKDRCGLAHCLLPESPGSPCQIGARYVDQAVTSLLTLMKISSDDLSEIEVHVAGGGNMVETLSKRPEYNVAAENIEAVSKHLQRLGMAIRSMDVGGELARQMCIDCLTVIVEVKKIESTIPSRRD